MPAVGNESCSEYCTKLVGGGRGGEGEGKGRKKGVAKGGGQREGGTSIKHVSVFKREKCIFPVSLLLNSHSIILLLTEREEKVLK